MVTRLGALGCGYLTLCKYFIINVQNHKEANLWEIQYPLSKISDAVFLIDCKIITT